MRPFAVSAVLTLSLFPCLNAAPMWKAIAKDLRLPTWAGFVPGKTNLLWVIEQDGVINEIDLGSQEKKIILDMRDRVERKGSEEGLLGLAFEPTFATSGRFYINYVNKKKCTSIERLTYRNHLVDADSRETLLEYKQDFENHNGGWLDFGPDNMLYIGNGDGGSANDPKQRAQDLSTPLGKILRIDVSSARGYEIPKDNPFVNQANARPEIWCYGLRNPWRCSFDPSTGDFWIADVGQNQWEEINHIHHKQGFGANFGWRLREGLIATPAKQVGGDAPKEHIEPVYVYKHGSGAFEGFSVTGGHVYRGPIRELQGRYVFADYQNPRVWSFKLVNNKAIDIQDHSNDWSKSGAKPAKISAFTVDVAGNLYAVDHVGVIYQLTDDTLQ